tara:strand:- start:203 stop:370 length:168 start_codon:yes stop_codon:yes gene_type:complete
MVLLLTASITCSQALNLLQRIAKVVGLTELQKTEIIVEIRKTIPFCPVTIRKDAK